jgi:hypothetical protein
VASTFIDSYRLEAIRTLKHLVLLENQESLRKRFTNGKSFFLSFGDLARRAKRVVQIEEKGRKKDKKVQKTVTPTKPSQLATVAPAERQLVSELYESPWDQLSRMDEAFQKRNAFQIKFPELLKKLREQNNLMWSQKQKVLRATRHRIDYCPENKAEKDLTKKLTNVRVYLSTVTDYSSLIVFYRDVDRCCPVIDNFGKIQIDKEIYNSMIGLLKTNKGNKYPLALKIFNNLQELGVYGSSEKIGNKPKPRTMSTQPPIEEDRGYDSTEIEDSQDESSQPRNTMENPD